MEVAVGLEDQYVVEDVGSVGRIVDRQREELRTLK